MSLLFTDDKGDVFELTPEELPSPSAGSMSQGFDGASAPVANATSKAHTEDQAVMTAKGSPLVMVTNVNDLSDSADSTTPITPPQRRKTYKMTPRKSEKKGRRSVSEQGNGGASTFEPYKVLMAYNEYGDLVEVEKHLKASSSVELTLTETLRLVYKAYHHKVSFCMTERHPCR